MKQHKWLWLTLSLCATCAVGAIGYTFFTGVGQADTSVIAKGPKGADPLPIRQVVLFNSGVGYFQREG